MYNKVQKGVRNMFKLPDLPYAYKALEPYIDEKTMRIHHGKHHAGYVDKLNQALEGNTDFLKMEIDKLVANMSQIPEEFEKAVRNNGGGHANHSLFWKVMTPNAKAKPEGKLAEAIKTKFTSLASFQEQFTQSALSRFGSGWAWLVVNNNDLGIISTKNQDSPLIDGAIPILGIDVWEHAYYLKYQNRRADYVKAWWNIVNWEEVLTRFKKATSQ